MKPLSFQWKIALLSMAVSGLVLGAFGLAVWGFVSRQKIESVDTEIRSLGARHPGWIANRGNYQRLDDALEFIFGPEHRNQVVLLVKDAAGGVLYASAGWPRSLDAQSLDSTLEDDPQATQGGARTGAADIAPGRGRGGAGRGFGPGGGGPPAFTKVPRFQTVSTADGDWRLGMLGTADTTLVIGVSYERVRAELGHLRNAFLLALPLALSLVGLGGWLIAGRALRPMQTIAETAERVTASGLDARIPASDEAPEIARVICVLNGMMDRLEASFRQATRFSADASHELKTPLAIMQGELENALQSAVAGSPEQRLFSDLLEQTQRLGTITRSLLWLAQADAGELKLARESVDLSAELEELLEDAHLLAQNADLRFTARVEPHLAALADRALLRTAVFNLVTNAIRYNENHGSIRFEAGACGDKIHIEIANTGPPIPPEHQARIFDRFYRATLATRSDAGGIGLGLSLAREIVRAHGGDLVLAQSGPVWTCFRCVLPREKPAA